MIFGRFDDRVHSVHNKEGALPDKDRPDRPMREHAGAGS
jgi:hypothetical protein